MKIKIRREKIRKPECCITQQYWIPLTQPLISFPPPLTDLRSVCSLEPGPLDLLGLALVLPGVVVEEDVVVRVEVLLQLVHSLTGVVGRLAEGRHL